MLKEEFKEIVPFIFNRNTKWHYETCGGYGEDNTMDDYKRDIIYTRLKFKIIAYQKGMKPRFRFKRKTFHWKYKNRELRKEYNYDYYQLLGKLVLIDSAGIPPFNYFHLIQRLLIGWFGGLKEYQRNSSFHNKIKIVPRDIRNMLIKRPIESIKIGRIIPKIDLREKLCKIKIPTLRLMPAMTPRR